MYHENMNNITIFNLLNNLSQHNNVAFAGLILP